MVSDYQLQDIPQLTGSSIGFHIVEIYGLPDITVPVAGPAMGTDTKVLVEWYMSSGEVRGICKVQAAISWKVEIGKFSHLITYGHYAFELIACLHGRPYLAQGST